MNTEKFLEGKKILICSYSFASFGGAELAGVEFADQLVKYGATPVFFSYDIDGPLREYIEKRFDTKVLTDKVYNLAKNDKELGNIELNINDYDYIWTQANFIPISIIKQINLTKKLPKFIFIHMSSLIAFPLDAPLLPSFEKKLASRVLSIGEEATEKCIYRILEKNIPLDYWNNPAPSEFRHLKPRRGELRKIAVISSSHPTEEVMNIEPLITQHNIQIDYIGKYNNNTQFVDAKFYDKYDLIIGIGKNAKYSLTSGVPIYIYGRFGGPGYLNDKNFKKSDYYNFSGRGFSEKTSEQIVGEIIKNYSNALMYHQDHKDEFVKKYSIDIVAKKLMLELEKEKPKEVRFSDEYINWLISMQISLMQRLRASASVRKLKNRIDRLSDRNDIIKVNNKNLKDKNEQLANKNEQLANEIKSYLSIKRSTKLTMGNIKRKIIGKR